MRNFLVFISLILCSYANAYPTNQEINQLIKLLNESKKAPVDELLSCFKLCYSKIECGSC